MFISMVFYRLNKAWTIVVAVGAPVFVFAVLPILMQAAGSESFVSRMLAGLVDWILSSPWAWISSSLSRRGSSRTRLAADAKGSDQSGAKVICAILEMPAWLPSGILIKE
jgi:hypothetical protein